MRFLITVVIGIVLFIIGNHLMDNYEGKISTIGAAVLIIGIGIIIFSLFLITPM